MRSPLSLDHLQLHLHKLGVHLEVHTGTSRGGAGRNRDGRGDPKPREQLDLGGWVVLGGIRAGGEWGLGCGGDGEPRDNQRFPEPAGRAESRPPRSALYELARLAPPWREPGSRGPAQAGGKRMPSPSSPPFLCSPLLHPSILLRHFISGAGRL